MIQFSEEEIRGLREKALRQPEILKWLREQVREVMEGEILVPAQGIGDWILYYFCPECSVELEFKRTQKEQFRCPRCGREYTGEPYQGAWWSHIHNQNANQCFHMGILYLLTEERTYADRVREILLRYAKYYAGYEVHGNIPCNGPGKAEAQTLDEAILLRTLALAYDLIQDTLVQKEKEAVLDGIFYPGAAFLLEHRGEQIHNHEVIINSAIAIMGILLGKKDWIQLAVYEPFGIRDQLEQGVLSDGMWFECAFSYHLYAMKSFFAYEKFARHTEYSLRSHPNYRKMLECVLRYRQEDGRLPLINDARPSQGGMEEYQIFEFAGQFMDNPEIRQILREGYPGDSRKKNLEAFLYGPEKLCGEELKGQKESCIAWDGGGLTMLRENGAVRLCFRHGPYAGEHEHFDKLSISIRKNGVEVSGDLGTTGYGAPMHYQYYKNTGTHNTVVINEGNQPPVDGRLLRAEEKDGVWYLEAEADFDKPHREPDSYAPVLWNTEDYGGVKMNRKIFSHSCWIGEIFTVEAPEERQIDWVMHFSGSAAVRPEQTPEAVFSEKKPFSFFREMGKFDAKALNMTEYRKDGIITRVYTDMGQHSLFQGKGPGNPSDEQENFLVERCFGKRAVFCHLMETAEGQAGLTDVAIEQTEEEIRFRFRDGEKRILRVSKNGTWIFEKD